MGYYELIYLVVLIGAVCTIGFLAMVLSFLKGRKKNQPSGDEARVIQEIHDGLVRMEKRIEAVETIVLDRSAKTPEAVDSPDK
jgi:phage shock protein B